MLVRKPDDEGFSLIEVIIAFFLLALIAVAILPSLYSGIRYSSEQSSAATATRALNARIEQLRNNTSVACADLQAAANPGTTATDGRGRTFSITGPLPSCTTSTHQQAVVLTLNAKDSNGSGLATVTAKIYLP
ncbi:type IV pilus modification PilV family protein [Microbacterium sp. ASV49]|uniref:Type II secretion system protein n=1 Tax=Microbacterium candidum TaxID=3041922 RepID=A0ABT7N3Y2_9MICO|nr:type II secretion system protein [Microbacterium sp. ASV49]MDL9981373.1 type II secretion system protein [Microbacterium sp. ASV49]